VTSCDTPSFRIGYLNWATSLIADAEIRALKSGATSLEVWP
jgi:hypothetical protein